MNETGMDAVVTSLTSSLSAANLWGIVGSVVPFLAISILFGLGFYLVKRILNKTPPDSELKMLAVGRFGVVLIIVKTIIAVLNPCEIHFLIVFFYECLYLS